jgi:hypothetical protein
MYLQGWKQVGLSEHRRMSQRCQTLPGSCENTAIQVKRYRLKIWEADDQRKCRRRSSASHVIRANRYYEKMLTWMNGSISRVSGQKPVSDPRS